MPDKELHYRDIALLPNYSECKSRADISLRTKLQINCEDIRSDVWEAPFILANMKTVISENLAKELAKKNYFYIMHRFDVDIPRFVEIMHGAGHYASISIGVHDTDIINRLHYNDLEPAYITIDIAHGHSKHVKGMIDHINSKWDREFSRPYIIAGNVCTTEGAEYLDECGVDAIKVGIAGGHVCTTKLMTGFSRPQFSAIQACRAGTDLPIIADGGIEHNGDIAKALVAGANMVMCGHMFAGYEESPGEKIILPDGRIMKEYFGSASEHNKNMKKHVEGRRIEIPYRGSLWEKIREVEESLRSSVSYAGGEDISALCPERVKWIVNGR